jgi:hypothetical protein
MTYAYDAGLIDRIKPRISQWEATTGKRISPTMLDALIKGQLSAEVDKANATRALDQRQSEINNQQSQQKKADKAAAVQGYVGLGTTAASLGLTYKALNKPSAMSEYLAAMKGVGAATPAYTGPMSATAPAFTGSAPTSLTAGYGSAEGAQAALGGGTAAVGGQAALGGSAAYTGATGTAAYGAAEGSGAAGVLGAEGGLAASAYFAPAAAGFVGGGIGHRLADKFSPIGGEKEKRIGGGILGGAAAGAAIGSILPGPGTAIGAGVGAVAGLVSSVFGW